MKKDDIIYFLVKESLFDDDSMKALELSENQWEEVYTELKEQTISGIPTEWVFSHVALPEILQNKWKKQYLCQVGFFYQLLWAQDELVKLMASHKIPMAILKGTAAAIYYPQPSIRLMGDIDFLVPKEEFQQAYHLMLDNGYQLKYEETHVDYHITLQKGKFIYEIHREPAGMPSGDEGEYLQNLMANGVHATDMVSIDAYEVPILPSLQNGIVLLLHIVKHIKNGLGLRQIIDWMMYVNQELHDEMWYNAMQPVLQKIQFEKLAKVVTRMCQIYLGLEKKNITWCAEISDDVCEKLIKYIMQQGNFGNKVKEEDKGIKIISQIRNPIQLFQLFQKRGEEKWEIQKKYPVLRMFAWFYTFCRYMSKIFHRKSPIKTLLFDVSNASDRRQLFDELGIGNDE